MTAIEEFVRAYVEAALWSTTDDNEVPMDTNYGPEDMAEEAMAEATAECCVFWDENIQDLEGLDPAQAGHDFWLTRCGHGVGFWDRDLGELGKRLTEASQRYGEKWLYVGDDGLIYSS